jgi:DNA-binding NarL/FixJ family response regulator
MAGAVDWREDDHMIRVALIDDHPAVLLGLRRFIDADPGMQVHAAAPTAAELANQLGDVRPDVLVIDNDPARGDGLRQCRRLKNRASSPGVVIYTASAGRQALAARVAHADALVDKTAPVGELLEAIRRAAARDVVLPDVPPDVYRIAVSHIDDEDLPVLAMLLDREPIAAIAKALRTDVGVVAWRSQRILGRLAPGARRRAEPVTT